MTIIIIKQHCLGSRSCGQCKQYDESLPDYAYGRQVEMQAGEELLIQCPKLAIMEVHDGPSK